MQVEAAVGQDGADREQVALSVKHLDGAARLAATRDRTPVSADGQPAGRVWCGGVGAVQIRCVDTAGRRQIAFGICGGNLQCFAIDLGRIQGDGEHAGWADHSCAEFNAIGAHHSHRAARLGAAAELAAISADHKLAGGSGRGDIRCADLHWQGHAAVAIKSNYVE